MVSSRWHAWMPRGLVLDSAQVVVDSALRPTSMAALTNALGWPEMSGTLSGRIPELRWRANTLSVAGDMTIELFDGTVRIAGLSVAHPLAIAPELRADIIARDLSLNQMSETFSFGRIEGRVDADVLGLVMQGWRPIAFDAYLRTPQGDRSRHRISQRAVDNLARLGGTQAVLSSTLLRFFESFSYRRLGLGCRLAAGVCTMRGVQPTQGGYYIVEGGGLPPRVDVIGFNSKVDFDTLLERLRSLRNVEDAVIR